MSLFEMKSRYKELMRIASSNEFMSETEFNELQALFVKIKRATK